MAEFKTRIQHKHDTAENWSKATSFSPLDGEIIVYEPDATHAYPRVKIGDGKTNVNTLPFIDEGVPAQINAAINAKIYVQAALPPDNAPIGAIWIDTNTTAITSAEGVEF